MNRFTLRWAAWFVILCLTTLLTAVPGCGRNDEQETSVVSGKALTPLTEAFVYAYRQDNGR